MVSFFKNKLLCGNKIYFSLVHVEYDKHAKWVKMSMVQPLYENKIGTDLIFSRAQQIFPSFSHDLSIYTVANLKY